MTFRRQWALQLLHLVATSLSDHFFADKQLKLKLFLKYEILQFGSISLMYSHFNSLTFYSVFVLLSVFIFNLSRK